MSKEQDAQAVGEKLAEIRNRLMGSPRDDELRSMQLQMNVLQRWAQLALAADDPIHNHDHSMSTDHNDHDHAIIFEAPMTRE